MRKTLKEIAKLIDGELAGSGDTVITGASGIKEACPGDITFLANPKYLPLAEKTNASAIVAGKDVAGLDKPVIRVENPSLAFVKIVSCFSPQGLSHPKGIHKTAIISKSAKLGKNVSVGPYTVVEAKVSIGDNTVIYSGCFIGQEVKIGKDSLIYPNVSIRERTSIGKNFIAHPGAVIGSDGFGFVTVEGRHRKIPQSGIVEIGDDVELGANVTIDRARFDKTRIGNGTKIDNLVHIAHNVIIGENCLIVAQAGISGSTTIGNNVTIAGQAGLVGHITVGDNAILAAQAGITKSVPANTMVSGYPAQPHDEAKRVNARIQNLSRLYKAVDELKKKVEELEKKLNEVK